MFSFYDFAKNMYFSKGYVETDKVMEEAERCLEAVVFNGNPIGNFELSNGDRNDESFDAPSATDLGPSFSGGGGPSLADTLGVGESPGPNRSNRNGNGTGSSPPRQTAPTLPSPPRPFVPAPTDRFQYDYDQSQFYARNHAIASYPPTTPPIATADPTSPAESSTTLQQQPVQPQPQPPPTQQQNFKASRGSSVLGSKYGYDLEYQPNSASDSSPNNNGGPSPSRYFPSSPSGYSTSGYSAVITEARVTTASEGRVTAAAFRKPSTQNINVLAAAGGRINPPASSGWNLSPAEAIRDQYRASSSAVDVNTAADSATPSTNSNSNGDGESVDGGGQVAERGLEKDIPMATTPPLRVQKRASAAGGPPSPSAGTVPGALPLPGTLPLPGSLPSAYS
jgi:hypothetical protein